MKSPATTIEYLTPLLTRVRAIQREITEAANQIEVAISVAATSDYPTAILRDVRDRLSRAETSLSEVLPHANAALVTFGS